MRRVLFAATAVAAVSALVVPALPALAAKGVPPAESVVKPLLLTLDQMKTATSYPGTLTSPGQDASCSVDTKEKTIGCGIAAQPSDWTVNYPFFASLHGFGTAAEATSFFNRVVKKPTAPGGATITVVKNAAREYSYVIHPSDGSSPFSLTAVRMKAGIAFGQCGAGSTDPSDAALVRCSTALAKAQAAKVKATRPRTPLG